MSNSANPPGEMTTRETTAQVVDDILNIYPQAFADEDLRPIVSTLLRGAYPVLSLAAFDTDALVGHVMFTRCGDASDHTSAALLAPLAVTPPCQTRGIGTALVQAGIRLLEEAGVRQIFVLGDPGYYGRFGFTAEQHVLPPCPIPRDWAPAWQSLRLKDRLSLPPGPLQVPEPWKDPALWSA